jgi:hypothetical protein
MEYKSTFCIITVTLVGSFFPLKHGFQFSIQEINNFYFQKSSINFGFGIQFSSGMHSFQKIFCSANYPNLLAGELSKDRNTEDTWVR